jgi:hypothetical protein
VTAAGHESPNTIKIRNHHLSLLLQPERGRILEVQSLRTGSHLVSWWPFKLDDPARVGGIGPKSVPPGTPVCKWTNTETSAAFNWKLPGGLALKKTVTLPSDSLVFHISLELVNQSPSARRFTLEKTAAVCPGFGGECPRPDSGVSHCRERAVFRRQGRPSERVDYEVFEHLSVERDDLEWAAFVDPVSDNLFAVVPPPGHSVIRTDYHWWYEWSDDVRLEPGAAYTADFHFAATGALDSPVIASEHVMAGLADCTLGAEGKGSGKVVFYALDDSAVGNEVSVSDRGRELVGGKPLPDGRDPFEVKLPTWDAADGLSLGVSVAGKFGEARVPACRCGEVYGQLAALCAKATADFEAGRLTRTKAASICAVKTIVDLEREKCPDDFEKIVEKAFYEASAIVDSPLGAVSLYTQSEKRAISRLADDIDLERALDRVRDALAREYDFSKPRFRDVAETPGARAASGALFEGALLLNILEDEEILALFRELLGRIVGAWKRFGQLCYETIHHGVALSNIIPAAALAFEKEWLSLEEEIDAQAMMIDLGGKIRRRGGIQMRLSNWWAMENAALAWEGALFPYLPEAAGYIDAARETFYWLLVHGTLPDGGFWEMSPSYHMVTLTHLHNIAEALLRTGVDLYRNGAGGRSLSEMVDFVKAIAVAPGELPAFDDGGRRLDPSVATAIAKRLHDGELYYHATAAYARADVEPGTETLFVPLPSPDAIEPSRESEVLVPSGKLILRSPSRSLSFAFDFGPHGGWHGHSDKLSFEAFWRGECIIPDAGRHKYEEPLHWEWFKTARAHNTVTLGERDRKPCAGRLLYFEDRPGFLTAAMSAPLEGAAVHRREVTLSGKTLLVDDFIENARPGDTIVWRMNSFTPVTIHGQTARFETDGLGVEITDVAGDAELAVAEVPISADRPPESFGVVTGHQLRISRPVTEKSERFLVRLDFTW